MACDLRIATCAPRFASAIAMRVLHFAMKRCSLCPLRVWAISLSFFKYRAHVPVVAPSTSKIQTSKIQKLINRAQARSRFLEFFSGLNLDGQLRVRAKLNLLLPLVVIRIRACRFARCQAHRSFK